MNEHEPGRLDLLEHRLRPGAYVPQDPGPRGSGNTLEVEDEQTPAWLEGPRMGARQCDRVLEVVIAVRVEDQIEVSLGQEGIAIASENGFHLVVPFGGCVLCDEVEKGLGDVDRMNDAVSPHALGEQTHVDAGTGADVGDAITRIDAHGGDDIVAGRVDLAALAGEPLGPFVDVEIGGDVPVVDVARTSGSATSAAMPCDAVASNQSARPWKRA